MQIDITAKIDDISVRKALSGANLTGGGRNKVAVICPVHPPYFERLKNFINHFYRLGLNNSADFWIVFSDEKDAENFCTETGLFERFLLMPKNIDVSNNAAAVRKKLYAVSKLSQLDYEYIFAVDADFVFIRTVDLKFICDRFFEEKIILSCRTKENEYLKVNEHCFSRFKNLPGSEKIDLSLYSWLSQPWIYKSDNVKKFFEVSGDPENFNKFTRDDFEYVLYAYYLILYENFEERVLPYVPFPFGEMSGENLPKKFFDQFKDFRLLLCMRGIYLQMQKYFPENEIMLITHLDRGNK